MWFIYLCKYREDKWGRCLGHGTVMSQGTAMPSRDPVSRDLLWTEGQFSLEDEQRIFSSSWEFSKRFSKNAELPCIVIQLWGKPQKNTVSGQRALENMIVQSHKLSIKVQCHQMALPLVSNARSIFQSNQDVPEGHLYHYNHYTGERGNHWDEKL